MKNSNLFLLMAALFALISCGTANRSAYYSGTQFRNSIYYTPDDNSQAYAQEQQYLQQLQERTTEAAEKSVPQQQYNTASKDTKTVYVGENNQVDITYEPGTTYSIVDDRESYEARLRKFDSPFYTINIDFYDPYTWWDYRYGWYTPYGGRWYANWSHPWYRSWWSWHSPHWNLHFSYNWGWYDPFYDPWWGPGYWPGYWHGHWAGHWPGYWPGYGPGYWPGYWPGYRPGYHPGHHPGHHPGGGPGARPDHRRDVYYGKRTSSPTYNAGRGNTPSGSNVAGRPNSGSVTRRSANATRINGGTRQPQMNVAPAERNEKVQNSTAQYGGNNQYRRVAPGQQTKSSANTVKNSSSSKGKADVTYSRGNSNSSRSSSYTRSSSSNNNSSYTRSSSSSQNRSSYSSGGATRSSGSSSSSGSSYRRR